LGIRHLFLLLLRAPKRLEKEFVPALEIGWLIAALSTRRRTTTGIETPDFSQISLVWHHTETDFLIQNKILD
jgi:hypothetical protein